MRRKRSHERHDWAWHEAHLATPWLSYHTATGRPLSEREWREGIEGKRQQMTMHDGQPPLMRQLVAEHNVRKAVELYRLEMHNAPKCPHGRVEASCAQCTFQKATGRGGEPLQRVRRWNDVQ
jgi:hypothetical protein